MSVFFVAASIPRRLKDERSGEIDRETLYELLWAGYGSRGLQGIHEGTVLAEQAATLGFETESWTLDASLAPQNRDWIRDLDVERVDFYFASRDEAESFRQEVSRRFHLKIDEVTEQPDQDWDAEWKRSFQGIDLPPHWFVMPPHRDREDVRRLFPERRLLVINPGAGFGTGTHETTQLILTLLANGIVDLNRPILDFGSGSGILAIGTALLGATKVDAVEIDPLANDNARENARLNGVENAIRFTETLDESHNGYALVIANILKPVLIEFSDELKKRMVSGSKLILSGLMQPDVDPVINAYRPLTHLETRANGDWRAIIFEKR